MVLRGLEQSRLVASYETADFRTQNPNDPKDQKLTRDLIDIVLCRCEAGQFHRWVVCNGQYKLVFWTGTATPSVEQMSEMVGDLVDE